MSNGYEEHLYDLREGYGDHPANVPAEAPTSTAVPTLVTPATCEPGCAGERNSEGLYCHCQGCGDNAADDKVNGYCALCCDHESWLRGGGPNYGKPGLYCEHCGKYKDDLLEYIAQHLDDFEEEDEETGRIGYRLPSWVNHREFNEYLNPMQEGEY